MNFSTYNQLVPYSVMIDELQYRLFGQYIPPKKPGQMKKTSLRTLRKGLTPSSHALSSNTQDADDQGRPKVHPPELSPFEYIEALEQKLLDEQDQIAISQGKQREDVALSLADYMMTTEQYSKIVHSKEMNDATLVVRKLT